MGGRSDWKRGHSIQVVPMTVDRFEYKVRSTSSARSIQPSHLARAANFCVGINVDGYRPSLLRSLHEQACRYCAHQGSWTHPLEFLSICTQEPAADGKSQVMGYCLQPRKFMQCTHL